jgi:hypothetical protein
VTDDLTDPAVIERAIRNLTPAEREEFDKLVAADPAIWRAQVGRQMEALLSDADIIGYGGAAGGGKTDLIAGLALTQHERTLILRREKVQTEGIIQRLTEILGTSDGYNSQKSQWRIGSKIIEFGGLDGPTDHQKWQGRPHDLKALDEVTEMREHQARFVIGWNRSSNAKQRTRTLMTFNPPTTIEGRWVIEFFGPWLNDMHPNPAKPGELRWFTTLAGADAEVQGPEPFVMFKGEPLYDFDPSDFRPEKILTPVSRTFIPSRVTDNYFYVKSGYIATLQSMPEPLRSQLLEGDFKAGVEDDEWQVIPTGWIDAAMARWTARERKGPMDSMGVDVSAGGKDEFIIARRHGTWFDELIGYPGTDFGNDGRVGASFVIKHRTDRAPVHVDVIGWGASVHTALITNEVQSVAVNVSHKSHEVTSDKSHQRFANVRAEIVWRMRESLDLNNADPCDLPPDPALRADLAAYRWKPTPQGIRVREKDEMKALLGRSPDRGDAVCLANMVTLKQSTRSDLLHQMAGGDNYDRFAELR